MRTLLRRLSLATLLALAVLVLVAGPAQAQSNCAPVSGTVYGAVYAKAWHLVGDFTIGRDVYPATIDVAMNRLKKDGDMWQGSETWTLDFGGGNAVQLVTSFVTEHMTNAGGIFHIREVGTFINGEGAFTHMVGTITAEGPFGPAVKLPEGVPLPTGSMYWVAPVQGIICGMNGR